MRFDRFGRHAYEWTPRKEAAAARRLRKERESAPLFAEQIAELQPSLESIRATRLAAVAKTEVNQRARLAAGWRKIRSEVQVIPAADRKAVLAYWNQHKHFPGTPFYLGYVVRQYHAGGLAALGCGHI